MRCFVLLLLLISVYASNEAVVITKVLNVRSTPELKSSVIGQVKLNDKVEVLLLGEKWSKIQVPLHCSAWVAADFLNDDNTVKSDLLKVRAGPSSAYKELGLLKKDTKVEVIATQDGWKKITPKKGLSAWVSTKYIDLIKDKTLRLKKAEQEKLHKAELEKLIATLEEQKNKIVLRTEKEYALMLETQLAEQKKSFEEKLQSAKTDEAAKLETENVLAIEKVKLIKKQELEEKIKAEAKKLEDLFKKDKKSLELKYKQEREKLIAQLQKKDNQDEKFQVNRKIKSLQGYVLKLSQESTVVDYALATKVDDKYVVLCYLKDMKEELKQHINKPIKIVGKEIYMDGWKYPVVHVLMVEKKE